MYDRCIVLYTHPLFFVYKMTVFVADGKLQNWNFFMIYRVLPV